MEKSHTHIAIHPYIESMGISQWYAPPSPQQNICQNEKTTVYLFSRLLEFAYDDRVVFSARNVP